MGSYAKQCDQRRKLCTVRSGFISIHWHLSQTDHIFNSMRHAPMHNCSIFQFQCVLSYGRM